MKITDAHELFVKEFFTFDNSIIFVGIGENCLSVGCTTKETIDSLPNEYNGFVVEKFLTEKIVPHNK